MQLTRSLLTASAALVLGLLPSIVVDAHISPRVQQIVQAMTLKDKAGQMVRRSRPSARCTVLHACLTRSPHPRTAFGVN